MSVAVDARGLKRVCTECGGRFYDMNNRPIKCPSCETEFTGEMKVKARRGRAAIDAETLTPAKAKEADVKSKDNAASADELDEDEEDEVEEAQELSLDDLETIEDADDVDEDDDEAADLDSIDDDELGDLGKDLGDLGAGLDLDEEDDELDADLEDVKANAATE